MAVQKEQRQEIVKKFRRSELDTGSTEVQVALLTSRIQSLTEHFKAHKKDNHGKRGLVMMVNKRNKLLAYLHKTNADKYLKLIADLGLRK